MLSSSRVVLVCVCLVLISSLGSASWIWWTPREVLVDGILVRRSAAEAWSESAAREWETQPMSLDAGEFVMAVTPREMGISRSLLEQPGFDVAAALHLLPSSASWRITVDEVAMETFFTEFAALADRLPTFSEAGASPGRALDVMAARELILDAVRSNQLFVRLPFREIAYVPPPAQEEASATFGVELAAHSSSFRDGGERWTRSRNIALAAVAIDGVTIAPGATFSFSEALGPRTFERGFMPAEELSGGELVTGIGGGICQVATGLFEVALRAGLRIVEQHPHSALPSYAAPGFDTAVAWEQKDLRIENTLPFHLRIRASAQDGTLTIQLLGSDRGPEVSIDTQAERDLDGSTRVTRVRTVGAGSAAVRDEASIHYSAHPRQPR